MVARVTIKEGIFTIPTSTPLISPQKHPKRTENSKVKVILSVALKTITLSPLTMASMEPTDRSISAVIHTIPIPMAITPITAE